MCKHIFSLTLSCFVLLGCNLNETSAPRVPSQLPENTTETPRLFAQEDWNIENAETTSPVSHELEDKTSPREETENPDTKLVDASTNTDDTSKSSEIIESNSEEKTSSEETILAAEAEFTLPKFPEIVGKITVFADYQCPYCRRFEHEVLAVIRQKYPNVQIEFFHFPLAIHPQAETAAKFAICAEQQEQFGQMNDALFATTDLSDTNLWTLSKEIQLDVDILAACLSAQETQDRIDEDIQRGRDMKVVGTPTFFIASTKYEGNHRLENVEKYLREAFS